MKHRIANLLVCASLLAAPGLARAEHTLAREARKPEAPKPVLEPQFFNVARHNGRMRKAAQQARRTVGVFISAVRRPAPGQHDFEVKKPFRQGLVVEHIWLSDVTFSGNRFHGYVDNRPQKIIGLKLGQRVSVNPCEISDWAFVENGRLVGGYTIRVLYAELSPAGRQALEKEARFRITAHHWP